MNKAKKVFYTIASGVVIGVALGVLFAPDEGVETRRRLRKLKNKFSCDGNGVDNNKRALEELSDVLQKELSIVNEKLDKLS